MNLNPAEGQNYAFDLREGCQREALTGWAYSTVHHGGVICMQELLLSGKDDVDNMADRTQRFQHLHANKCHN